MEMTPQQAQAVHEHGRSLIVIAGAGSGKTRVLVERYLALLDRNPGWPLNALVAITFTHKAAQEMRDRVRQALEDRLHSAPDDSARALWAARLASMDSARIDTIHGLCAALLRANAAEAGLDPGFAVLDQTEASIVLDDALDAALQAALDDPASGAPLLFEQYDAGSLRAALTAFIATDLPAPPADPFAVWQAMWAADTAAALDALCADPAFVEAANWSPPGAWPGPDDKLGAAWETAHASLDALFGADPLEERFQALRALGAINRTGGSKANWGGEDIVKESRAALAVLQAAGKAAPTTIGEPPGPLDRQAVELLPLWRGLVERAQAVYRAAKRRQRALDFDDLERLTVDLLARRPDVAARYRTAEFRHLLVDEFQDTNGAQWAIIRALADSGPDGGLFLVGYQKQSIYAFRGADVSVFHEARARLGPQAEIALARSFRTHQPLVTALNALFARLLTRDPASPAYAYQTDLGAPMDAARRDPPGAGPFIEMLLVNQSAGDDNSAAEARRREAFEIAQRLHALVAAQTPVYDRRSGQPRPLAYGDVALLFQSLSSVTVYEEVFKAQGLPFLTVSGRGYYDRQEVWDLLNLLRALYNPADDLALASALRAPLFGLSDDALLALRLLAGADGAPLPLWAALERADAAPADERELAASAAACLRELRALAGRVTISELLRAALDRTGFLAALTGLPDGARRRANVEKLVAKAESSGRITLGAFSQYIADLSAREAREGEAPLETQGAVTLMTVHASKGLEFPLVLLADTGWQRGSADKPLLTLDRESGLACRVYDADSHALADTFGWRRADRLQRLREDAERRRLLYVAATRAQDYLLISGPVSQGKNGWTCKANSWLAWLLDALDAEADLDSADSADGVVAARGWGAYRLRVASAPPPDDALSGGTPARCAWDEPGVRAARALPGPAQAPPLLAAVPGKRTARARHLAVTHLMDLGGTDFDENCRRRFRRSVLHDAPAYVQPVTRRRSDSRLIGEIVHEALRWWGPVHSGLDSLLRDLAWEHGVVDEAEQAYLVREAERLLRSLQHSDIFAWLETARQLYQELPFIFSQGDRILHGVVDLLIQRGDGSWAIVDYKTSYVPGVPLREHAQRYHLQVGAYAQALSTHLILAGLLRPGAAPDVYIHYIRHEQTVTVTADEWRAALATLEQQISKVLT